MNRINKFNKSWTQQILDSSHIGVLVVDKFRNNLFVNSQLCKLFGYKESELLETTARVFHLSDDSFTKFGKEVFNYVLDGEPVEMDYRFRKKDGTVFWGHISGDFIKNNEEVLWIVIDIDQRKKLEFKNAQQAEILSQIHDGIVTTDLEAKITSFNHGAEIVTGYKAYEVIGKSIEMFYDVEDAKTRKQKREILFKEGSLHQELRFIKKDGTYIYTDLSASVLKDSEGKIIGVVSYVQDITQRRLAQEKMEYQSYHDALTGLPNRVLFKEGLVHAIKKAKHNKTILALLFIDLDHFKEINDSLGHQVGDKLLQETTKRLYTVLREQDVLSRLGGDEFGVIIEGLSKAQEASSFAKKILDTLAEPLEIDGNTLYVSSSIGISLYPEDGTTSENLLKFADSAMYKAKNEGRNTFQYYSAEMTEIALERVMMEVSLRRAIKKKEFVVYYQPQVNGRTDKLVGMEALVRWKHPDLGLIPPDKFIPLAESSGLIVELDRLVMREAMLQFKEWYKVGYNPGKLSMNLAVKQLLRGDFFSVLTSLIDEVGCKFINLELEVTETQIMSNPELAIEILKKVSALGIDLAIDDFGTGYSSLSYLKKLPINKLKIDQSFVKDLPNDEEDAGITRAVIALAKSLNLNIIAEGVETVEQKNFIVENGCDNIQGYYYSRPIPALEMEEYLNKANFRKDFLI